jgi:hypothetical protein
MVNVIPMANKILIEKILLQQMNKAMFELRRQEQSSHVMCLDLQSIHRLTDLPHISSGLRDKDTR